MPLIGTSDRRLVITPPQAKRPEKGGETEQPVARERLRGTAAAWRDDGLKTRVVGRRGQELMETPCGPRIADSMCPISSGACEAREEERREDASVADMPSSLPPVASPVAGPARPEPVREQERIITLDVLRGVAVLGILLVNIQTFNFTFSEFSTLSWRELAPIDAAAKLFVKFFAEFKFITIFSLLFGMGLAIQSRRAQQRGAPFARTYVRRLLILLLIGLAHGLLLWYGDVLFLYALVGLVAILFRNVRPRTLLVVAVCLFFVPFGLMGGCVAIAPDQDLSSPPDWEKIAGDYERSYTGSQDDPSYKATMKFYGFMADEKRIYQSGAWGEMVAHRAVIYLLLINMANVIIIGWRCLALFLLGIYLVRGGFFDDSDRHRRAYRWFVIGGLAVGVPMQVAAIIVENLGHRTGLMSLTDTALVYVATVGMALAYVGAISLLCRSPRWVDRLRPFAAVGRMALTNYLAHSIVCGLIFYSYGLGLFGTVGVATTLLIVLLVYIAQLILCPIWLRRFRFGPMEWLWRSLTYWRLQPMRR